jgi:hypothetical protein
MSDFDEKMMQRLKRLEREVERLQRWEKPIVLTDHGGLAGLADNDHPQYRLASSIRLTSLGALADDSAISVTPTNVSGVLFFRTFGGDSWAIVFYDATSPTAYAISVSAGSNTNVTTGALTGTTGTDGRFTVSAHTDGKIYFENRRGSTLYPGYAAI